MKKKIYSKIDAIAYKFDIRRRIEKVNARAARKVLSPLTKEEKKAFYDVWGKEGWNPVSFEFYKAFGCPFNACYVPNDYYDFAEHVLNLRWSAFFLQHKGNLKYIIPAKNRPVTILQKIDGHIVYEDNTELTQEEALGILSRKAEFVYKIAMGTGGGRGVRKVSPEDNIAELFGPNDLIFQEVVRQSSFLAQFNADSVNTFRLLTLNINGNCTLLSSFLRMGAKGSFVDNLCSGGGVLVGISQDGKLSSFGIDKKYQKIYFAPSGLSFSGISIPNWEAIKEKVTGFHKKIPYANLIGWDITLDESGEPIVIEINLDSAEIEAHQIFNGPVFGERLQEVKDYIEKRRPMLRHSMITY